jgi:CheY-specific phosphatase CheX
MENIKKIKELLTTAIFEVLEKMFYIFAEPVRSDNGIYHMKSAISFSGSINGSMQILFSKDITETMVKNMLNLEQSDITDQIIADCVKEAINMVCGNFVRKLDPERVFHLSIPTYELISGNLHRDQQISGHEVSLIFASENGNIEVSVTTDLEIL